MNRPKIPLEQAKTPLAPEALAMLSEALRKKHRSEIANDELSLVGKTGARCAWLECFVGGTKRHRFELFVTDVPGTDLDGALGVLIDFLDGILDEFFSAERDAYLSLDFSLYRFGEHEVYGRSELQNTEAENEADALLKAAGFDPNDVH